MRYIYKNYLKTFLKNWIQTLGTVLFIMMMITIVIGMLSSPLQITTIVDRYGARNNSYNQALLVNSPNNRRGSFFSNEFLYDYVYQNEAYSGEDENGQHVILAQASPYEILSPAYKTSLNQMINNVGANRLVERQNFIGRNLSEAIALYRQGGLISLTNGLEITTNTGAVNQTNLNLVIDSLSNLLVVDGRLAILQNYGQRLNDQEVLFRLVMKILTLFNNNNLEIDLASLGDGQFDDIENQEITTDAQMKFIMDTLLRALFDNVFSEPRPNTTWNFSTFEVFGPEVYWQLAWKDNQEVYHDYSYDFNQFVINQIFNDPQNPQLYNIDKGFRYLVENEKSFYLAQNTTDSLFPRFAIELKTVNNTNALNQLQLETGNLPDPIRFRDLVNRDATRRIIPTIIINSSYMEANNLHLNDMIEIPESAALTNILLPARQPADTFLTGAIPFQIVGSGSKYDDLVPSVKFTPFLENIENYANGYVDNRLFSTIRSSRWNFTSINDNAYTAKFFFRNLWSSSDNVLNQLTLNANNNQTVYEDNSIITFAESLANQNLNNIRVMVTVFIILGIVVLILSFVFINFIIKKELNETRRQIGIFKSFGYKISELSGIFAFKTYLTILVGIIIGLIASIPLQLYAVSLYIDGIMFSFAHIYLNPIFLVIVLIGIPVTFLTLSYLLTLGYLREPTLSLLSNGAKISKWTARPNILMRKLSEKNKWFAYRLQWAFVQRSMGKFVTVQILFAFAALSYTLMFGAQTLLGSLVTQGFSALNDRTDHEFWWRNRTELNIPIDDDRFNVTNIDDFANQNFEYVGFDNDTGLGEAIQANEQSSDSRYRISFVVDSYANEFDGNGHSHALDLLMPLQYYKDLYVYQPDRSPNLTGDNAIKFIDKDYYLNWFLTLKITEFEQNIIDSVRNNFFFNFVDVERYVEQHPDVRLDLTPALTGDQAALNALQRELPKTIFGIRALNDERLKNNMFLANITKIIILQLAEQNFDNQISTWLENNALLEPNGWYLESDVQRAIEVAKNSQIGREFSPNDERYWGLLNNPLIDFDALTNPDAPGGNGLSLTRLPAETVSLIMSALMLEKEQSGDINNESVITMNQLFFNRQTELLVYELRVANANRQQTGGRDINNGVLLRMFDSQSNEYGQYTNLLSHSGVSDATYRRLGDEILDPQTINGILPYGLARTFNIRVGDTFTIITNTIHREEININVIGINQDITFSLGAGGWPIDVDFTQFRAKFFNPELNFLFNSGLPIFNKLLSQEPMLTGNIDVSDIASSINSMKFVGKNLSMVIDNNSAIFGSVFNGMIDFTRLFNVQIDSNFLLLTNPNIAASANNADVVPYNILRTGVDNIIGIVNNVLVLFMVLLAVLLLIILVVVMNIVVEEAAEIILTLRAIGYKGLEVNWIVMGSYIIGAFISFILAYLLSLVIWVVFLEVVGNLVQIYIFMQFSWQAPIITFLVLAFILMVGWIAANMRVNKTPLSRITNFN